MYKRQVRQLAELVIAGVVGAAGVDEQAVFSLHLRDAVHDIERTIIVEQVEQHDPDHNDRDHTYDDQDVSLAQIRLLGALAVSLGPVSYTHLDVYKRQKLASAGGDAR